MYSGNFSSVFLWRFIVHLFGLFLKYIRRSYGVNSEKKIPVLGGSGGKTNENNGEIDSKEMGCDQIEEKEIHKLESEEENVCNASTSTSKYEFIAGNSVCAFIEEPQIMNFTVHEMFLVSCEESFPGQNSPGKYDCSSKLDFSSSRVGLDCEPISLEFGVDSCSLRNIDCYELSGEEEVTKERETESSVFALTNEVLVLEQNVCDALSGEEVAKQGKTENSVLALNYQGQHEIIEKEEIDDKKVEKIELFDEPKLSLSNSDDFWATIYEFDGFLSSNEKFDCDSDEVEPQKLICMGNSRMDFDQDSPRSINQENNSQVDGVDIEFELEGVESLYIELEPQKYCSSNDVEKHLANSGVKDSERDQQSLHNGELKDLDGSKNREEDEDTLASDMVMEQKELIRKMKKEIRQLKIIGLPTILEESVSPRIEQDLRPLKIDEKIGFKDLMDEIQTFYRKYVDKMKKLDILCQQTMYAIDLALNKNVTNQLIKSFQTQNLLSIILKKNKQGSDQKVFRDLQSDLELVYVSQLCLSWELLKWQHYKAEELQVHDPIGFHQHNEVAGEFQKFQVLLHRFIEDEPYHQGTRVQQFVNTRQGLPALLQVPLVKEDLNRGRRKDEDDGISVKMLIEIIGSSMHSFWDFIHADKFEVYDIPIIGVQWVQVILQDPSDAELLAEIRSSLQKKEKRLKDLLRTGNCLMKKFQKHRDQRLSHEMVVAQVELRLVSRVLSMPKVTTDQLLWCQKKLNKVDIIGKNIYLESSFLLFPC